AGGLLSSEACQRVRRTGQERAGGQLLGGVCQKAGSDHKLVILEPVRAGVDERRGNARLLARPGRSHLSKRALNGGIGRGGPSGPPFFWLKTGNRERYCRNKFVQAKP